jgi:putative hydrolase of the HAD superfamily
MESITGKSNFSSLRVLFIDLDDTLYPSDSGIWGMIRERMQQYMLDEMGFPPEEVPTLRHRLWKQYGTTLRGLQMEYEVDMADFLDYVHDIPVEEHLQPDPELSQFLNSLPQRKFIFTNAHTTHAKRVMDLLEVTDQFEGIIDIYAISPHCKPQLEAFHTALKIVNSAPEHCLLVDDSPGNLATAKALDMKTVSIGSRRHDGSPHIESIHELKLLF